jgi:hypothetical protein
MTTLRKYNNMNCNYDCDESPSLSSNDCLMKDVTVLMYSGVDGLFVLVFRHGLIQENLNIYFESIGIKCFDYWYFSCIHRKNEIHLLRHCKSHSLWSICILRFLPIYIKSLCSLSMYFVFSIWM